MKIAQQEYEELLHHIEEVTGRTMQTPKDFEYLTMRIFDRTRIQLSLSTLKRLWGYTGKDEASRGEIRLSTLNILSSYVGYTDWEAFTSRQQSKDGEDSSTVFFGQRTLQASSLHVGDLIEVMWRPNRCVVLRYSGNNIFLVNKSLHSKLSAGDTFSCSVFVEHQPLTLIDLIHEGGQPCGYVCGKVGGITIHYPIS